MLDQLDLYPGVTLDVLHGQAAAYRKEPTTVPALLALFMLELADTRIVHCQVPAAIAGERIRQRWHESPTRRAHADTHGDEPRQHAAVHNSFDRVRLDVPELEVDTSDGYRPSLDEILAFVNARR